MSDYTPFKMNGRPMIKGTSAHTSALKQKTPAEKIEKQRTLQGKLQRLEQRKEEGKKTLLGNVRRKRLSKKIAKHQKNVINTDPTIRSWMKTKENPVEIKQDAPSSWGAAAKGKKGRG